MAAVAGVGLLGKAVALLDQLRWEAAKKRFCVIPPLNEDNAFCDEEGQSEKPVRLLGLFPV